MPTRNEEEDCYYATAQTSALSLDSLFEELGDDLLMSPEGPTVILQLVQRSESRKSPGRSRGVTL